MSLIEQMEVKEDKKEKDGQGISTPKETALKQSQSQAQPATQTANVSAKVRKTNTTPKVTGVASQGHPGPTAGPVKDKEGSRSRSGGGNNGNKEVLDVAEVLSPRQTRTRTLANRSQDAFSRLNLSGGHYGNYHLSSQNSANTNNSTKDSASGSNYIYNRDVGSTTKNCPRVRRGSFSQVKAHFTTRGSASGQSKKNKSFQEIQQFLLHESSNLIQQPSSNSIYGLKQSRHFKPSCGKIMEIWNYAEQATNWKTTRKGRQKQTQTYVSLNSCGTETDFEAGNENPPTSHLSDSVKAESVIIPKAYDPYNKNLLFCQLYEKQELTTGPIHDLDCQDQNSSKHTQSTKTMTKLDLTTSNSSNANSRCSYDYDYNPFETPKKTYYKKSEVITNDEHYRASDSDNYSDRNNQKSWDTPMRPLLSSDTHLELLIKVPKKEFLQEFHQLQHEFNIDRMNAHQQCQRSPAPACPVSPNFSFSELHNKFNPTMKIEFSDQKEQQLYSKMSKMTSLNSKSDSTMTDDQLWKVWAQEQLKMSSTTGIPKMSQTLSRTSHTSSEYEDTDSDDHKNKAQNFKLTSVSSWQRFQLTSEFSNPRFLSDTVTVSSQAALDCDTENEKEQLTNATARKSDAKANNNNKTKTDIKPNPIQDDFDMDFGEMHRNRNIRSYFNDKTIKCSSVLKHNEMLPGSGSRSCNVRESPSQNQKEHQLTGANSRRRKSRSKSRTLSCTSLRSISNSDSVNSTKKRHRQTGDPDYCERPASANLDSECDPKKQGLESESESGPGLRRSAAEDGKTPRSQKQFKLKNLKSKCQSKQQPQRHRQRRRRSKNSRKKTPNSDYEHEYEKWKPEQDPDLTSDQFTTFATFASASKSKSRHRETRCRQCMADTADTTTTNKTDSEILSQSKSTKMADGSLYSIEDLEDFQKIYEEENQNANSFTVCRLTSIFDGVEANFDSKFPRARVPSSNSKSELKTVNSSDFLFPEGRSWDDDLDEDYNNDPYDPYHYHNDMSNPGLLKSGMEKEMAKMSPNLYRNKNGMQNNLDQQGIEGFEKATGKEIEPYFDMPHECDSIYGLMKMQEELNQRNNNNNSNIQSTEILNSAELAKLWSSGKDEIATATDPVSDPTDDLVEPSPATMRTNDEQFKRNYLDKSKCQENIRRSPKYFPWGFSTRAYSKAEGPNFERRSTRVSTGMIISFKRWLGKIL